MSYSEWTRETFGVDIPAPGTLFAMNFPPDSPWGAKAHNALIGVELEYVEHLCRTLKAENVRGALVEFGTFEGWWVNQLFELSERIGLDRPVIGYDSFAGLSAPNPEHDDPFWKEGQYAASQELVARNVKQAERPRIALIPGFFRDSLVAEPATSVGYIAYARIDCDIYEPALDCLRYLGPRLSHGAVLIFDDWPHRTDVGEAKAFIEWLPTVPHLRFEYLFYGTWGHFYLRVWHREHVTPG